MEDKGDRMIIATPIKVYSTNHIDVHRYKGTEGTILVGEHYER